MPTNQVPAGQLLLVFVFSVITGAMGEELGWRGFLLPRLQTQLSPFVSTLIVGVVWAVWHLPLWLIPGSNWRENIPYWAFALILVSSSFLYTWVVNSTKGSTLMAAIIHFTMNFVPNLFIVFGLLPQADIFIISAILYTIYAGIIVFVSRPFLGRVSPDVMEVMIQKLN